MNSVGNVRPLGIWITLAALYISSGLSSANYVSKLHYFYAYDVTKDRR